MYPVKGLRGISLSEAEFGSQGLQYDRRFAVCRVEKDGSLAALTLSRAASCSLFTQELSDDEIHVSYAMPKESLVSYDKLQETTLQIPLNPELAGLERRELNMHRSMVSVYLMGDDYDAWFTSCFGFECLLVYIGNERRPVLGTFSPRNPKAETQTGLFSTISSYIFGGQPEPDWLAFADMAPVLVTSDASLSDVEKRVTGGGPVERLTFRPNIVVDGEAAFDEDYWTELSIDGSSAITLTKMCGRCSSLNIDYKTGKQAEGDRGTLLKKLMKDRRVDTGAKFQPVFGRYGFLSDGVENLQLAVGDEIEVFKRDQDRPVWDWPSRAETPRYYRYS